MRAIGAYGVPFQAFPAPAGASFLLERACNAPTLPALRLPSPHGRACHCRLHVRVTLASPRNTPVTRTLHAEPRASRLTSDPTLGDNPQP